MIAPGGERGGWLDAPDALTAALVAVLRGRRGARIAIPDDLGGAHASDDVGPDHLVLALALGAAQARGPAAAQAQAAALLRAATGAAAGIDEPAEPPPPLPEADALSPRGLRLRRALVHLAAARGAQEVERAGLPAGAVAVSAACTLCFACVPACPTAALRAEGATLAFAEDACVQCGRCAEICPENAVTLLPRLRRDPPVVTLVADAPATCSECGARFGARRALDGVRARLEATGWAEKHPELLARLGWCEGCRARV